MSIAKSKSVVKTAFLGRTVAIVGGATYKPLICGMYFGTLKQRESTVDIFNYTEMKKI